VAILPISFTLAPGAAVTGQIVAKTGRYRWGVWIGWVLTTLGLGIMTLLDIDTKPQQWIFIILVTGTGAGILFTAIMFAIQAASDEKDVAYAIAMFSFFRAMGQAFGVAIGGVVFQNSLQGRLEQSQNFAVRAKEYASDAVGLIQIIHDMPNGDDKEELRKAYSDSLRTIWYCMLAFAAFSMIISVFTKELSLDRQMQSEHGLKENPKRNGDRET
jgi:MFS family permease